MRLVVPLAAKPLPRPRGKRGQHAYLPADYQEWAEGFTIMLRLAAAHAHQAMPEPPYLVRLLFAPDSVTLEVEHSPDRRGGQQGDIDNLCKALLDVMVAAGLVGNDRLVHALEARFGDNAE